MKKYSLFISLISALLLLSYTPANAGFITGFVPGASSTGGQLVGLGGPITTGAEGNSDYVGEFADNPNQAAFTIDVFELNSGFNVDFTLADGANVNTEYAFAVTVNNMLLSGKEINGLDIEITNVAIGGTALAFDTTTPRPFASGDGFPLAFETPNIAGDHIRFGGLSGGGGGIPIGGSQVLNFSLVLADFGVIAPGSTFSLRFTANPEPEAIFLGSFTLAIGGFFVYRRRKQQLELQTETATESA